MTAFLEEVSERTDVEPDAWSYFPNADGYDAVLWFDDGEIVWRDLAVLREFWGVHSVQSHSDGKSSSRLAVRLVEV
jgi:hypothetical protein